MRRPTATARKANTSTWAGPLPPGSIRRWRSNRLRLWPRPSHLRPDHAAGIDARPATLESDLQALDRRLAAAAEVIGDSPLLFSHPVYQYLIRRYGLNGVEVHWEPNEAPDGPEWDHLEHRLGTFPAQWMLWEAEPLESTIAGLEDLGIGSLLFDPCANRPSTGDYMTTMNANVGSLEKIAETLKPEP